MEILEYNDFYDSSDVDMLADPAGIYEKKESILRKKTFDFALEILDLQDALNISRQFTLANQLGSCGTSIGANTHEAEYAQSRADFISKLSIALKEANETFYFLSLIARRNHYPDVATKLLADLQAIVRIITASIKTAKSKL